jgi:hypothetical protein
VLHVIAEYAKFIMNIDLIINLTYCGHSEAASDNFRTVEFYNNLKAGEEYMT